MPRHIVIAICAALLAACHDWRPTQHVRLPAAPDRYLRYDPPIVVNLPDTGGFLINTQPLHQESLEVVLKSALEWRDTARRFAFVEYNPRRSWADYQRVADGITAVGGKAFDLDLTMAPLFPSDSNAQEAPPRQ